MSRFNDASDFTSLPDLLIGGLSNEERVANILEKLREIDRKFYFLPTEEEYSVGDFDEVKTSYSLKVEDIRLNDLATTFSGLSLWSIDLDTADVVIDFTAIQIPILFVLLKKLYYQYKKTNLRLLYSEPDSYAMGRKTVFTENISVVQNIPGYFCSEQQVGVKRRLLIVLLGFEGKLVSETYRSVQPDKIIAINGFPAFKPGLQNISLLNNVQILNEIEMDHEILSSPANDPFETGKLLTSLYMKYKDKFNIYIAPLGTKPQALGACLCAIKNKDINIIFPFPEKIRSKSSLGVGKQWMYEIEL